MIIHDRLAIGMHASAAYSARQVRPVYPRVGHGCCIDKHFGPATGCDLREMARAGPVRRRPSGYVDLQHYAE